MGTSAGSPRPLSDAVLGTGIWLAWSPGNRILYVGPDGNNIVSVSPLTEEIESLVEADAAGTWYSTPRVAPDGTRLALHLTRHGTAIVVKDLDDPASRPSYMTRSYGFGYSDQTVDALEYRGSSIVLKAKVRQPPTRQSSPRRRRKCSRETRKASAKDGAGARKGWVAPKV